MLIAFSRAASYSYSTYAHIAAVMTWDDAVMMLGGGRPGDYSSVAVVLFSIIADSFQL